MARSPLPPLIVDASDLHSPVESPFREKLHSAIVALRHWLLEPENRRHEWRILDRPRELLVEYATNRPASHLFSLLRSAAQFRDRVDRVVVIGNHRDQRTIQVLKEACCDPFFDELTRGQRGSRPRMSFVADPFDHDQARGLLELVNHLPENHQAESRWGLLALCDDDELEGRRHEPALRLLTSALRSRAGEANWRQRLLLVAPSGHPWRCWAEEQQYADTITPEPNWQETGALGRLYSPGVLLACGLLGIDVVKVLEGAAQVTARLLGDEADSQPVWQFVMTQLGRAFQAPFPECWVTAWASALEAFPAWFVELAGTSSPDYPGRTRYRLCHQSQLPGVVEDPAFAGVVMNLTAAQPRTTCDPPSENLERFFVVRETLRHRGCPYLEIRLPSVNEPSLGQLLQTMLLVSAVEAKLMPYTDRGDTSTRPLY